MNMLLKKLLCALLPDPVPDVPKNSTNYLVEENPQEELPSFLDSHSYWEYEQWENQNN
ncbi:hypothetical protein NJE30_003046 [Salmonella enterica subsp. enterica serovar 61:-:1,5]|uniref:hypothetical protein n=1 Tax=Enterobacteriaceae TaxID=543 RepID=UPI000ACF2727|nr:MULTISPECIES: hypothetical protein [Enterobacteriaceae]EFU8577989.1 hypothetical protein [Salmonella enterica]EGI4846524.1 hypothetical protein [Salmonella enterica subsp. diarizonae]EHN7915690.1 hypothetical protein [Salmonella enterica subsp. diarizonae serovar 61:k:1,5,(7)]EJJ5819951.1 hypothetical protein [Salmonella enterica subsp. enterica serovar 61:-:1,5]EKR2022503.1 hypothetical protein [Salmonella enterica subsp. diarizonae serovar 61:k:1,5,7]HBZ6179486.1 hypothetical protein [Sa